MKQKPLGYMVIYDDGNDGCLIIPQKHDTDPKAPKNALVSVGTGEAPVLFTTRQNARRAIHSTFHYNKAHWESSWGDKIEHYRIVPVMPATEEPR